MEHLLESHGFSEITCQTMYSFDQLAGRGRKVFCRSSEAEFAYVDLSAYQFEGHALDSDEVRDELFAILRAAHAHSKCPVVLNSRDLLEGMLYAIGVMNVDKVIHLIADYAGQPSEKRLGVWRQVMVEDQVRYLERLLAVRCPQELIEEFIVNPQARRALMFLSAAWNECQVPLQLDFSRVCYKNQHLVFASDIPDGKLEGAFLSSRPCAGYQITWNA
ncbi:MAG: hypothetical protein ACOCWQ_04850 [Nanoarchaeota archaeon]